MFVKTNLVSFKFLIAKTSGQDDESRLLRLYQAAIKYDISLKGQIAQSFFSKASALTQSEHKSIKPIAYLRYSMEFDEGYREKVAAFAYETSQQYTEKGFLDEAIPYAYLSKEIDPKNLQNIGILLYKIGIQFAERGEEEKFIETVTEAKQLYPEYNNDEEPFLWWIGEYYYQLSEIETAKNYYEKLTKQYPTTSRGQKAVQVVADLIEQQKSIFFQDDFSTADKWSRVGGEWRINNAFLHSK